MSEYVVVTGASFGIGKKTAQILSQNGFKVIAVARNIAELNKIKSENIDVYQLDITKDQEIQSFANYIADKKIIALINNAGGGFGGANDIVNDNPDHWRMAYDLNVVGALNMTKICVPKMSDGGNVVLVTSACGHDVYKGGSGYTVAKHAEVGLVKLLRLELLNKNIRVTEISPGNVDSRGDRQPGTALNPEDVADAIRWAIMVPKHVNVESISIFHINNLSR